MQVDIRVSGYEHNPQVTSVAPFDASTAVLPSSHSTQSWKLVPLVAAANSLSKQTRSSAIVRSEEPAHTDWQGEEVVTRREKDRELKEATRRRWKGHNLEERQSTIAQSTIDTCRRRRHPAALCLSGVHSKARTGTSSCHLVSVPGCR